MTEGLHRYLRALQGHSDTPRPPTVLLTLFSLFRLPIGNHGAAQPRLELPSPWFSRTKGDQMIHTIRESAEEYLDAVVPD